MTEPEKCPRCHGTAFEPGILEGSGEVAFRVRNARFLSMAPDSIRVQARICMSCGGIELTGNVQTVALLTGESPGG